MDKDSDEEDNEGVRQRREQLTALKEAAYDLLGKAWPKDPHTQGRVKIALYIFTNIYIVKSLFD